MNRRRLVATIALPGLVWAFGAAGAAFAQEAASSSACVKCHTDLEKMDEYGAAAAGKAAAIAG